MKKLVITGISSFIGYNLADHFHLKDYEVFGTATQSINKYQGIQKQRIDLLVNKGIQIEKLDISQDDQLEKLITTIHPDFWINHAGYTKNYESYDYDFKEGIRINVLPLFKLYPLLSREGCKGIIVTGTNAEYSISDVPSRECEFCSPSTPYGLSKLFETQAAYQLSNQHKLPTRIARVFNPFGRLDSPNRIIPYVISQLKSDSMADLSPCEQKRDFIYIKEIVSIYESLLYDLPRQLCDIINVSSGEAHRIKDIIILIQKEMGKSSSFLNFGARAMRSGEPKISSGSIKKLTDTLGYTFKYTLFESISDYLNDCLDQNIS